MKYPLSCDTWDEQELNAIRRVMDSGRFTMGPEVEKFEMQFADFFETEHAKMVNSGSSANLLMMQTARYSPEFDMDEGDAIIVPAVSWSTTFYPVNQAGFRMVFADVDKNSLNLCPKSVRRILENNEDENIRAIFAVNLLGNPADLHELRQICNEYDLYFFEDNCESLGAVLDGQFAGTYADMGTFSFFFSHHMQTMEGGMIVTNSERSAQYIDSMRAHGWLRTLPQTNYLHNKTGDAFEDSFRFVLPGYSVRPLEMSGAVGQVQLEKWPEMFEMRKKNAEEFVNVFGGDDRMTIQKENGDSSWFGFSIIIDERYDRKGVTNALQKAGIEVRPIVAGNFMRNPVLKHLHYSAPDIYANANTIHDYGFFLGNDSINIEDKINYAYDVINAELCSQ